MADDLGAIHYLGPAPAPAGPYDVWQLYGLDQLWEMVRDEDGVASFTQVGAWHRMAELCSEQADQLQRALDQLMVHWPARPGSAAELFQQTVVRMIGSMRDSAATASATKQPLTDITMALGRAKDSLAVLVARATVFEKQEQAVRTRATYPGRGATALTPPADQIPPIGWRNQLDIQARQVMATTDAIVGAAAQQIVPLAKYRLGLPSEPISHDSTSGRPNSSGGNAVGAPQISSPAFDPPRPPSGLTSSLAPAEPTLAGSPAEPADSPFAIGGDGTSPAGAYGEASSVGSSFGPVMAPGAVIGAPRASDYRTSASGSTGGSRATSAATRSVPLVAPPARGINRAPSGAGQSAVRAGGRRRRRSDPTDSWEVPHGVPSVLEPDPEPIEHDPGPGVIGLDR